MDSNGSATIQAALPALYETAYHYYAAGKYQDAQEVFQILTTIDTQNYHHWMGLAGTLQMQNQFQKALDTYGAAALLETTETNPYPHFHAAECLLSLGKTKRAFIAFESALQIAKKNELYCPLVKKINFIKERWAHVIGRKSKSTANQAAVSI